MEGNYGWEWASVGGLGQILERSLDQFRSPFIRITRTVKFHRAIAFIFRILQNSKRLRHVHVHGLVLFASSISLTWQMPYAWLNICLIPSIGILRRFRRHGIPKIRQRMQPRTIHFRNHLHDEKRIFAHRIIVFQVYHHVFLGGVLGHVATNSPPRAPRSAPNP